MAGKATQSEWQSAGIGNWLLTILRFAVTRDDTDRMCVLEVAQKLDRQDPDANPTFSFFARASAEICNAIVADDDARRQAILNRYFNAIDDHRLRYTLKAAIAFRLERLASSKPEKRRREYLWRGLPSR